LHKNFWGELIGTFIVVFFGCGSVAVTVLFSSHVGLFQVAAIWGLGVTLAIYVTRHLSCAHLNPAVSVAMLIAGRMHWKKLPVYLVSQFLGSFLAAASLYGLFASSIARYETVHGILRGTPASTKTAMIFGEFYATDGALSFSTANAFAAEAMGTFLLVFMILALIDGCNVGRPDDTLTPLFIGVSVSVIICVIAPLTQAGLNPARDLSPRIFAFLAGWGPASLPDHHYGFLTVYVVGPFAGAIAASLVTRLLQPLMHPITRAGEEAAVETAELSAETATKGCE
jgi:glycerol uptake facilitator protein